MVIERSNINRTHPHNFQLAFIPFLHLLNFSHIYTHTCAPARDSHTHTHRTNTNKSSHKQCFFVAATVACISCAFNPGCGRCCCGGFAVVVTSSSSSWSRSWRAGPRCPWSTTVWTWSTVCSWKTNTCRSTIRRTPPPGWCWMPPPLIRCTFYETKSCSLIRTKFLDRCHVLLCGTRRTGRLAVHSGFAGWTLSTGPAGTAYRT